MDTRDRQAIDGLFGRLNEVERQSGPRDAEAEAFIRERVGQQPAAPYFMAQTIVVQEQALEAAQHRIAELEAQAARPAGGLFGGLFGGGRPAPQPYRQQPSFGRAGGLPQVPPPGAMPMQGRGGGFLAGAAQTAMGVAGGVLLGNAIAGMFSGDEAQAAEPEPQAEDSGFDSFGDEEY